MIQIDIPGFGKLSLLHAVFDYNGTLATDGKMIENVRERLVKLGEIIDIHVITADTFGMAASQLKGIPVKLHILKKTNEDEQKQKYIKSLGPDKVAAFGNGNNDRSMLQAARIGVAVIGKEGCSAKAIQSSDIIVTSILDGLDLLLQSLRCKATLRFWKAQHGQARTKKE